MDALDRIDAQIVRWLQKNARLSNKELARRVGLAPSSCLERVRRLIRDGVFEGFHADVDPHAVGAGVQALISVRLTHHSRPMVRSFRSYILDRPEVRGVFLITGAIDFLVHVALKDTDHLREFVLTAFTEREEVDRIETSLIFDYQRNEELPVYLDFYND